MHRENDNSVLGLPARVAESCVASELVPDVALLGLCDNMAKHTGVRLHRAGKSCSAKSLFHRVPRYAKLFFRSVAPRLRRFACDLSLCMRGLVRLLASDRARKGACSPFVRPEVM